MRAFFHEFTQEFKRKPWLSINLRVTTWAGSPMPTHGITDKKGPQIRSVPNSRELWDARTALPRSLLTCRVRSTPRACKFHLRAKGWHEGAIR